MFDADVVPTRLPVVGLQVLSTSRTTDANVLSLAPSEAIGLARGPAWGKGAWISATVSSAESVGIPVSTILPLLLEAAPGDDGGDRVRPELMRNVDLAVRVDSETGIELPIWICVVTEVVYARSVDVVLSANRGREGRDGDAVVRHDRDTRR